jgi:hypothetical protein
MYFELYQGVALNASDTNAHFITSLRGIVSAEMCANQCLFIPGMFRSTRAVQRLHAIGSR